MRARASVRTHAFVVNLEKKPEAVTSRLLILTKNDAVLTNDLYRMRRQLS
jgi:hypothetical protein